jgi:hypothetical protein
MYASFEMGNSVINRLKNQLKLTLDIGAAGCYSAIWMPLTRRNACIATSEVAIKILGNRWLNRPGKKQGKTVINRGNHEGNQDH